MPSWSGVGFLQPGNGFLSSFYTESDKNLPAK
jgi:hypothetical protein